MAKKEKKSKLDKAQERLTELPKLKTEKQAQINAETDKNKKKQLEKEYRELEKQERCSNDYINLVSKYSV